MSKPDKEPLEDAFSAGDMVDAPAPIAAVEAKPGPAPDAPDSAPDSKIVINSAATPLPNNDHELFAQAIFKGMSHYVAYQRFISPKATKTEAVAGASKLFHRPEVEARTLYFREEVAKTPANAIDNNELRRIMAVIARSGCPNERIAASKQLRDWIKEDNQAQAAKSISDPAQVAFHLSGLARASAGWEAGQRVEFLQTCLGALDDLLHITPADWQAALAPDRAGAPPKTENSDFIGVSDPPKQVTIALPSQDQANP